MNIAEDFCILWWYEEMWCQSYENKFFKNSFENGKRKKVVKSRNGKKKWKKQIWSILLRNPYGFEGDEKINHNQEKTRFFSQNCQKTIDFIKKSSVFWRRTWKLLKRQQNQENIVYFQHFRKYTIIFIKKSLWFWERAKNQLKSRISMLFQKYQKLFDFINKSLRF